MNYIVDYTKLMREVGISQRQSDTLIKVVRGMIERSDLATKRDLELVESRLDKKIDTVEFRLDKKIDSVEFKLDKRITEVESNLRGEFKELELRLIQKLSAVIISSIGLASGFIIFVIKY